MYFPEFSEEQAISFYWNAGTLLKNAGNQMTDNPQIIDAFNRLSREIKKALPYWKEQDIDDLPHDNKIEAMIDLDGEIRTEIRNLIESIINEHES